MTGIGVFGGTFDPIHLGHLTVAQDVHAALGLERVLFVPAGTPPHRAAPNVPPATRRSMVEAAIAGDPRFELWTGELERDGPSWTVDTLEALGAEYPGHRLHLILGADQFARFGTWRAPDRIAELATLVVVGRGGVASDATTWAHEVVDIVRIDVSSSMIRERIRRKEPIRYLVPAAVARIIESGDWYNNG